MRDIYANIAAVPALAPAVQASAAQGTAIDLNGAGGVAFVVNTGAVAGSGDFGLTLQESDSGTSGWTVVAPAQIDSNAPATLAADATYRLGYRGWKRYVRLSVTKAGGTSIIAGAAAVFVPLTRPAA
ncbi:MAG: hypothetical protein ACK4GC_02020 [Paracoccaceae bacterium]|uniref:hypothetical protein n=1 Tax=Paracoccus TaxID=265 RepID=UPI00086965B5|nr:MULTISPECIES: hypothetical protein [Paracoccus]ODT57546.1 MAG: hypothetical protein ABS73_16240 [Paracoccus sp. SCN 68-21]